MHHRVRRILDFFWCAFGDNFTLIHHRDPVRYFIGALHIMGDHDRGNFLFIMQVADKFIDTVCGNRVNSGSRLVIKDDLWFYTERPGKRNALFHSAA